MKAFVMVSGFVLFLVCGLLAITIAYLPPIMILLYFYQYFAQHNNEALKPLLLAVIAWIIGRLWVNKVVMMIVENLAEKVRSAKESLDI